MLARIRKAMENKDQGFTLIELLVVMIIIGILSAIAIPVFLNQREKAADTATKSDMRTVANEQESYFTDAQTYLTVSSDSDTGTITIGDNEISLSDGVSVRVKALSDVGTEASSGTVATGFCISGWNSKGSKASDAADESYIYNSLDGGFATTLTTC
ncbi:type IV pilin protein [Kineococcus arenarius]|uniref:type IV pilin protein n=1 Tax=unclassified Kineococcus TaxID=2621656 RepID=UPI003D7F061D